MKHALTTLLLAAALGATATAADTDPVARAEAIIAEAERRSAGYGDLRAVARMTIHNGRGSRAIRELDISILETDDGGSRSLTVVADPRDVAGTALLTHTAGNGETEQWLYLPALGRVKRIASSGRSGPFMGSEFTYEDFSAQPPEHYDFRWLRDETFNGLDVHVIERRPKPGLASAYDHQVVWMDVEHLRVHRVEYMSRRGELMKVLIVRGYEPYREKYWRAERFVMRNELTGADTTLEWRDIEMGIGLSARDFDVNALKSSR